MEESLAVPAMCSQDNIQGQVLVKNKKILIIDDQSFNIEALMIILRYKIGLNSKFYCETALSGR